MLELYTDGGCAIKNPSLHGIAWAFCVVERISGEASFLTGNLLHKESGRITTQQCGKFPATNNLAEMIAVVKGLEYVKRVFPKEKVLWYTDSDLTRNRLLAGYSMDKLPKNVRERGLESRNIVSQGRLVGGHPTKKELVAGVNKKGLPVSEFNVLVDKMCKEECKKLLLNKGD